MTAKPPRFRFEGLAGDAPCPFRHGLYQLMRNRVLADALIEETDAGWADFAVCIHPGNHQARRLAEAIGGKTDAVEAFRAIAGADAVVELDPMAVVEAVRGQGAPWRHWCDWMRLRYFDAPRAPRRQRPPGGAGTDPTRTP